jgi:hypothetical protein
MIHGTTCETAMAEYPTAILVRSWAWTAGAQFHARKTIKKERQNRMWVTRREHAIVAESNGNAFMLTPLCDGQPPNSVVTFFLVNRSNKDKSLSTMFRII